MIYKKPVPLPSFVWSILHALTPSIPTTTPNSALFYPFRREGNGITESKVIHLASLSEGVVELGLGGGSAGRWASLFAAAQSQLPGWERWFMWKVQDGVQI